MGILRLLLAIGVVAEHSGVSIMVGSFTAVQAFFMISGFYMSLILSNGSYGVRTFYMSRAVRIYPMYWAAIAFAGLYYFIATRYGIDTYGSRGFEAIWSETGDLLTRVWYAVSVPTLLGTDFGYFFERFDRLAVVWVPMIPIWTLALEIYFYALCPFLFRRSNSFLFAALALSIGGRVLLYTQGFDAEPWHARFFPFEIAFFLAGMLAHRAYNYLSAKGIMDRIAKVAGVPLLLGVAALTLGFYPIAAALDWPPVYGVQSYGLSPLYYVLVFASLPVLFHLTRAHKIDAYIGEYSYPIYIFHYMFVEIFAQSGVLKGTGLEPVYLVLGLTLVHSVLAVHLLQMPLDRFRHARFKNTAQTGAQSVASTP